MPLVLSTRKDCADNRAHLVADVDAPRKEQIFDLPQRQRITDVEHNREADHLRRTVEIAKGIAHRRRLGMSPARLKPICSDNAPRRDDRAYPAKHLRRGGHAGNRGGGNRTADNPREVLILSDVVLPILVEIVKRAYPARHREPLRL